MATQLRARLVDGHAGGAGGAATFVLARGGFGLVAVALAAGRVVASGMGRR